MFVPVRHHYCRIIKKIVDYCCNEKKKIINKGSFILHRQQVVCKHHQSFRLKKLKNQMLSENEIFHRCLFLWEALSENNLETR